MKYCYLIGLFFFSLTFNAYANNLLIGTISAAPPFEFQDAEKNFSGFDIDIMYEICRRIGSKCTFKAFKFHDLFGALNNNEIDLAIASIIITPERKKHFLFSLPYKFNNQQFVTLANSKFQNTSELTGKRIGIYKDSPEEANVYKKFNGNINIKLYEDVTHLLDALNNNQVDAVVLEDSRAQYWISNSSHSFKLLGRPFRAGEGYGIAAKLGQEQLMGNINAALEKMESDNTYLKIYRLYF